MPDTLSTNGEEGGLNRRERAWEGNRNSSTKFDGFESLIEESQKWGDEEDRAGSRYGNTRCLIVNCRDWDYISLCDHQNIEPCLYFLI